MLSSNSLRQQENTVGGIREAISARPTVRPTPARAHGPTRTSLQVFSERHFFFVFAVFVEEAGGSVVALSDSVEGGSDGGVFYVQYSCCGVWGAVHNQRFEDLSLSGAEA